MGRTALAVAFLAACAAPHARFAGVAGLGSEVSLAGLGLLGWVALGGLPRTAGSGTGATPTGAVGLALPGVALGAGLDLAAGRAELEIAATAACGLAFVWILAAAAERGRGSPLLACAWWLLVPCLAILPAVARWGRGAATAAVGASPLGWVFLRALDPGSGAVRWTDLPWVPLALAGGLLALAHALPEKDPRP